MILKRDIKPDTMSQTDPTFQMGVDPWPGGTYEPPLLGDFNFGQENNNYSFSSPCYADTALHFSDVCSPVSTCSSNQTHDGDAIKTEPDLWTAENAVLTVTGHDFDDVQTELMDRPNWTNQDLELLKIEDIFQVDPSDLIQTPTLAELNSVDESMTDLFACKKEEPVSKPYEIIPKSIDKLDSTLSNLREPEQTVVYPNRVSGQLTMMPAAADAPKQDLLAKNPGLRALLTQSSSTFQTSAVCQTAAAESKSPTFGSSLASGDLILASQKASSSHLFASHQALPSCSAQVQSVVPVKKESVSQVSAVLPSVLPKNQKWDEFNTLKGTECKQVERSLQPFSETERRWEEIVDYIHKKDDDGTPLAKRTKLEQVSAQRQKVNCKSLAKQDMTKDEDVLEIDDPAGSDVDADLGKMDFLLTDDSDSESETFLKPPSCRRKQRFFWEYNLQAKGQKGERLHVLDDAMDPHVLGKASDPVFLPDIHISGIKHSGKARKGDGNDLTPNPRKLYSIGQELKHLSRTINNMLPVSEVPATVRTKSRREKNKLASRACRLKKKAHHESNKLKLFGLEREHEALMKTLTLIKREMLQRIQYPSTKYSETLCEYLDQLAKERLQGVMVGDSAEFIVEILQNIVKGHPTGGLQL